MIVFFGPAGAGKSVQGQMLAARNGWRWLSAGQLLRDTRDPELFAQMRTGGLVNPEKVNKLIGEALGRAKDIDRVVLDGYPRQLAQAKWLIEHRPEHGRDVALVIVLEVLCAELLHRLKVPLRQRTWTGPRLPSPHRTTARSTDGWGARRRPAALCSRVSARKAPRPARGCRHWR